jgi:hypothetical protein
VISLAFYGSGVLLAALLDGRPRLSELVLLGIAPIGAFGIVVNAFAPISLAMRWSAVAVAIIAAVWHGWQSRVDPKEAGLFLLSLAFF